MTRLICFVFSLFLMTASALACLSKAPPESGDAASAFSDFKQTLESMKSRSFAETYCAFPTSDKRFALELFASAFRSYAGEDRETLARLSIMIPDIRENVAYVAAHGKIREVDDEWESVGVMRIIEHLLARFPETKSILTMQVQAETEALFQKALNAVSAKEQQSDEKIQQARDKIAEYERKKKELLDNIQTLSDVRRNHRSMRQELELQLRR